MLRIAKKYTLSLVDYVYIIFGSFLAAVSFQVFLLPNNIVSGGVTGLSVSANAVFGWDPAFFQYGLNIPLLIFCFVALGKEAGYKTILSSLLLPFFLSFIGDWDPVTKEPLLAAIFGGGVTGLGIGIVFRAKSSTGGTSILIQVLYQYLHLPLGISTLLVDGVVILVALLVFDAETVMFSMIALYIVSRTIDLVQLGFNRNKNVFIISDNPGDIRDEILHSMERGVTNLGIRGGYGNSDKDMLMAVIQEREFTLLKEVVLKADADAFVVAMPASEVLGRGFSLHKYFPVNETEWTDEK
ncbi:YitT family protein [Alkalibacterium kapii]|uniref:Membrane protein n=1 Tax=Alkalibacterium kapii TaxID=426704 RepID=A0A511ATG6_9LACT|nr:YitT family protein [Alkalibacterium kapii]GEK91488.1 membrane protein [Alkalibacterium kapii]